MKGKRPTTIYSAGLRITAALALCAFILCGCSLSDSSSMSTEPAATAAAASPVSGSEPAGTAAESSSYGKETDETQNPDSTQSSRNTKQPAKTTTKNSQTSKDSESSSLTEGSRQSGSTQTSSPAATTSPSSSKQTEKAEPANATVTSKVTASSSKATDKKQTTSKRSEQAPEVEYHIYADGYVTRYDELKLRNLTKKQRKAYNSLSEGIWKMQKDIKIEHNAIRQEDASDFLYIVLGTMPEVNYVTGTFRVTVSGGYVNKYNIDYSLSAKKAEEEHRAIRAAASKIIGSLRSDMSDIEKVKYFHDYIITHCEYSSGGGKSSYTAYGCLVEGKAVCEGYAMAMDYLCEKAGIYSLLVSGESTNSSGKTLTHIWNKINIDGKWYNFDVTWDDPVSAFGADYVRYDYFAVTDKDIEQTHMVEKNIFGYYPAAASYDENYHRKNGLYIESREQADTAVINAIADSLKEDRICASVKCSKELYDEMCSLIMSSDDNTGEHMVSIYLRAACEKTGISRKYGGFYMIKNEKLGIIAIVLK